MQRVRVNGAADVERARRHRQPREEARPWKGRPLGPFAVPRPGPAGRQQPRDERLELHETEAREDRHQRQQVARVAPAPVLRVQTPRSRAGQGLDLSSKHQCIFVLVYRYEMYCYEM